MRYPRDLHGHGPNFKITWPDGARIAVQFVINYEEGGENCVLHGDAASEAFLSEIVGAQPWQGQRHWNMESIYEYGARAGFWRLHRMFTERGVPATVYGVATALKRSPEQVAAMQDAGWEIASHGLKWIEHKDFSAERERQEIAEAIRLHTIVTGERPRGWYTGRCSDNTLDLVTQAGGFDYVSDAYADDLPYWHEHAGRHQLVIPYTLDSNDMRFATPQGFNSGDQFFSYLKDSFDVLYAEGTAGAPKMLSIGLHCRLVGRPGRAAALARFLDYVQSHEKVWLAKRIDIAHYWTENYPYKAWDDRPSRVGEEAFVAKFGGVFEHSKWIAKRAFQGELSPANDTAIGLAAVLSAVFREASVEERLAVLIAHPDLAGKLAQAKRLTESSTNEQASAGLDALTDAERERFTTLNTAYVEKFKFPFIMAVKGRTKGEILAAFESRINNDRETEFETACRQVERIAYLRLKDMLPS
ncbi:allantoinase PuuE [Ensifer sesbaniae]|uniref:allantoinase PuuE n=1 Tax=Ensifer sesbaniae TaxID=1214071 RepID=UPI001AEE64B3|nr:allantoinase PuuE [Ensifer sesbaniae]NRQ16851.1 Uric acid degradation bifunctional protein PucL [Ensifer sesbaniae]